MARAKVTELPPDNGARIVIYDGMCELAGSPRARQRVISLHRLFEHVIGRLRILVPRELHLEGERPYFDEKLNACVEADIARRAVDGVTLGDQPPLIAYPDGKPRPYHAGLQPALRRLESDNAALRRTGFDAHKLVPSLADTKRSPGFQALVNSMREHGYLKQFPILRGADGEVVDGRARLAAADVTDVTPVEMPEKHRPTNRVDTPLHRVVLLLDVNATRITDEVRNEVLEAVAEKTGRPWPAIEADLLSTRDWRRVDPRSYVATFHVEEVPFRADEPKPSVPVTTDDRVRVGINQLVTAAGLRDWKFETELRPFVVEEMGRTQLKSKPAIFVEISNAIEGIERMQAHRREKKLKLEPQWEVVKNWLIDQWQARASADASDEAAELRQQAEQYA